MQYEFTLFCSNHIWCVLTELMDDKAELCVLPLWPLSLQYSALHLSTTNVSVSMALLTQSNMALNLHRGLVSQRLSLLPHISLYPLGLFSARASTFFIACIRIYFYCTHCGSPLVYHTVEMMTWSSLSKEMSCLFQICGLYIWASTFSTVPLGSSSVFTPVGNWKTENQPCRHVIISPSRQIS